MQKVVIDTNVFVSALIHRGFSYHIVNDLFIEGKLDLCISDEVLQEYYLVLNRKKFSKFPDFVSKAEALLVDIETKSTKFFPTTKLTIISVKDDNKFLELTDKSKANYLITGNTNDFTIKKYKKTRILTPREYWEDFKPVE
jgi:uncharacterized protein